MNWMVLDVSFIRPRVHERSCQHPAVENFPDQPQARSWTRGGVAQLDLSRIYFVFFLYLFGGQNRLQAAK
jgi:hypothetical protein